MRIYHVPKCIPWNKRIGTVRHLVAYQGDPEVLIRSVRATRDALGPSVFLDSGAFGAWRRGHSLDVGVYSDVCRMISPLVDAYASLDVIDDWADTLAKYETMRERGLSPVPTFHYGEPLHALDRILDTFDGYLGLGGLVKKSRKARREWLDPVWSRLVRHRRWPFKVHGWGMTDTELMPRYPWFSVDSHSVAAATRGGNFFDGGRAERIRVQTDLWQSGSHGIVRARAYKEQLEEIARYATEKWRAQGIVFDEGEER